MLFGGTEGSFFTFYTTTFFWFGARESEREREKRETTDGEGEEGDREEERGSTLDVSLGGVITVDEEVTTETIKTRWCHWDRGLGRKGGGS